MRNTLLTVSLFLVSLLNMVLSQTYDFPACALQCQTTTNPGPCALQDNACLCGYAPFMSALTVCVQSGCNQADATLAQNQYAMICEQALANSTSSVSSTATGTGSLPASSPATSSTSSSASNGLGTAAVVGIIIGAMILLGFVAPVVWYLFSQRLQTKQGIHTTKNGTVDEEARGKDNGFTMKMVDTPTTPYTMSMPSTPSDNSVVQPRDGYQSGLPGRYAEDIGLYDRPSLDSVRVANQPEKDLPAPPPYIPGQIPGPSRLDAKTGPYPLPSTPDGKI